MTGGDDTRLATCGSPFCQLGLLTVPTCSRRTLRRTPLDGNTVGIPQIEYISGGQGHPPPIVEQTGRSGARVDHGSVGRIEVVRREHGTIEVHLDVHSRDLPTG